MSENRRKYGYDFIPLDEIGETGTLIGSVGYKPVSAVYVLGIAAVLFLVIGHLFGILMALICAAGAAFIQFAVKDHPVMDVYDDAVIMYHPADPSQGIRYTNEDIQKWSVNKEGSYQISLSLKNYEIHVAATYQIGKANRLLRKTMPQKSIMSLLNKSHREDTLFNPKRRKR